MNFGRVTVLKLFVCAVILIVILFAGNEGVEARKRGKKNPDGRGKHKGRRNRARRRDMQPLSQDEFNILHPVRNPSMLEALKSEKAISSTTPPTNKNKHTSSWTEAVLKVTTKKDGISFSHEPTGKFGYHSKLEPIVGKVVHVYDPNFRTHYGCNHNIGNLHHIPKGEPWIALIERGKCYFFNKIRLAEVNQASAVVIYNDRRGRTELMNTVGTNVVSLMINKEDGHRIISMIDGGSLVTMAIDVGKSHNSSHNSAPSHPESASKVLISTTIGETHKNTSKMDGDAESMTKENLHLRQVPRVSPEELESAIDDVTLSLPGCAVRLRVSNFQILLFLALSVLFCAVINIT